MGWNNSYGVPISSLPDTKTIWEVSGRFIKKLLIKSGKSAVATYITSPFNIVDL